MFEGFAEFEWDKGNIDKNLRKLKVSDQECEQVFFNNPLIVTEDEKHSVHEKRYAAFGKTDAKRRLYLIFTMRNRRIRLISARDMNKKDKKNYEKAEETEKNS